MPAKAGFSEVDARSHEALTRFFTRTDGWNPTDLHMPFDDLLQREVEEEEGLEPAGEYEFKQRRIGVMLFFEFLLARGATPMDLFRQLAAIGRAMHVPPFHAMTMHEIAMMEGQSAAAHSYRCKIISGELELAGMKGSRLPGQKSKAASESYKECRKGNKNRLGGKKVTEPKRERHGSFLRALHVGKRAPENTEHCPHGTAGVSQSLGSTSNTEHCPHGAVGVSQSLGSTSNPQEPPNE